MADQAQPTAAAPATAAVDEAAPAVHGNGDHDGTQPGTAQEAIAPSEAEPRPAETVAAPTSEGANGEAAEQAAPASVPAEVQAGAKEEAPTSEEQPMNVDGDTNGKPTDISAEPSASEAAASMTANAEDGAAAVTAATAAAAPVEAPAVITKATPAAVAAAFIPPPRVKKTVPPQPPTQPAAITASTFQTQVQGQGNTSRQLAGEQLHRSRLAEEPRDPETWLKLIDIVLERGNLDEIRKTYDDFFAIFPTAAVQWVAYLDLELAHSNFAQVEAIFARCLRNTPSMDLWRFYLSYTRRVNPLPPATGGAADAAEETPREKTRRIIEAAYEFCLGYIGREKDSGNIWMEYIHFIKEREVRAVYKEGQKMDDLRRVYHRALSVPLNNIELIWRDYDQWESSLNKVTAKKFLADRSAAYMTARSALRELHALVDHLHRPALPRLPAWAATHLHSAARLDAERDRELAEDWKTYLAWEARNPLRLDDPAALQARVIGVYKRAMMTMRFYPEIWYSASSYCASVGRSEEAVEWLKNGMEACPGSFLLSFAFVDLQESRKQTAECSTILDSLLQDMHGKIEAKQKQVADECAAIDAEGEAARAALLEAKRKTGAVEDLAGDEREVERQQEERRAARKRVIEDAARPQIDELKEAAALIWIKYMQFLRRTEGIRSTRALFGKARKSPYCTWQVWEANALIEYHCSKDKTVATKVFELALKTYGSDEAFVTRYLEFLITINDDSNARALLERVIPTFPPERARPIWDRWAEYEYAFGDLESIQKMEARLAETYPDEQPIKRFLDRNTYMDLDVISVRDMGFQPLLPGANAAERAVAATKDLGGANDGSFLDGTKTASAAAGRRLRSTAGAGMGGTGYDADEPASKRPRLARDRDSASPAPGDRKVSGGVGNGGAAAAGVGVGAGVGAVGVPGKTGRVGGGASKREESPSGADDRRLGIVERPGAIHVPIPDAVLFFMDILPRVDLFDGPKLNEHDMIDCILSMNVPLPPPTGPAGMMGRGGDVGGGGGFGGGIRGRRGGFRRRY